MLMFQIIFRRFTRISSDIIQNLHNNFNTLHSFALVNRFWCRLAILLLREDPFSIKCQKNLTFHLLDTYFLFLNENDKSKMKKLNSINLIQICTNLYLIIPV